jgi:6-phosphogluconolactonase
MAITNASSKLAHPVPFHGFLLTILGLAAQAFLGVNAGAIAKADEGTDTMIFVGCYTGDGPQDSRGIYVVDFDPTNGQLGQPRLAGETTNPSFLEIDPNGRRLYSVAETRSEQGRSGAALIGWEIGDKGDLREIGRAPTSGDGPCFVALSPDRSLAGVANYGGGSVALFAITKSGAPELVSTAQHRGSSTNKSRQGEAHAHSFRFFPDGKSAVAADLGTDELVVYDIADGRDLVRNNKRTTRVPAGHGPRHMVFSPDGKFLLVIEELSSMITVFRITDAQLQLVGDHSTLPDGFDGSNTTAEIQFSPSGQYVYGSNRGHDSIAVFRFESETGNLTPLAHVPSGGDTPRNFRFNHDGRWMITANQSSNNLVVFSVGEDGIPKANGQQASLSRPVCVKFLP